MASTIKEFVPSELFKYLKSHKGANKRVLKDNEKMLIADYSDAEVNNKMYEFRQLDIFSYYKQICMNKYNFINAITGFPQFFPELNGSQTKSQKITFLDDNFTKLLYDKLLFEAFSPDRITQPIYFDIRQVSKTNNNTYYSFMFMYNLFSNIGFFGSQQAKTLEEIYTQIFSQAIKDLNRGYMNIYIEKTKETKIFQKDDGQKVFSNFRIFLNEYLPAEYHDELNATQIFKMQLALNFLRVQTSDAIIVTVLQLVLPGIMSNMGLYANKEWMRPANDYYFKISKDGNLVSCCKVFSIFYSDIRRSGKALYQYNSIIVNYVIDCDTMNCFVNINIIHSNESRLTKLIESYNKDNPEYLQEEQKSTLKYFYKNPNIVPKLSNEFVANIQNITNEKIKNVAKMELSKTSTYLEIDSKTVPQILYYFKYDLSFGYSTYIDFLFSQIPNLYIFLTAINKLTSSNTKTFTDYIIPWRNSSFIQQKLNDYNNIFSIYQFFIDDIPFYIPIGKIITVSRKYLIIYKFDISLIPDEIKQQYMVFIQILDNWSSSNDFTTIYHTYKQSLNLSSAQLSLFTLILAFESLSNYVVIHKKITKSLDIELVSTDSMPKNLNNLLEYYYSIALQFDKIYNDVNQNQNRHQSKLHTRKSSNKNLHHSNKNLATNKKSVKLPSINKQKQSFQLWSAENNSVSKDTLFKGNKITMKNAEPKKKPKPKMHGPIKWSSAASEIETRV